MKRKFKPIMLWVLSLIIFLSSFSAPIQAQALSEDYGTDLYPNTQNFISNQRNIEVEDGISTSFEVDLYSNSSLNKGITTQAFYLPNQFIVTTTPYSSYFLITLTNVGADRISSATVSLRLNDNITGKYLASHTKKFTNLKVGTTSFKWYRSKSNTVEEQITTSLVGYDGGQNFSGSAKTVRWNFVGGAYGTILSYGGHVHHCPANSVNGLTTYNGPALRMLTSDHKKTASYGSKATAVAYRNKQKQLISSGKFDVAMQMDVDDIRSKFGTKYNKAITQMINYAVGKGYIKSGKVK
ncbi:MAG TPA: hypothetical protein GX396_04640 [Tissierellia bacterium]|nr:hypothetical protein [Tissierellia bacterium]